MLMNIFELLTVLAIIVAGYFGGKLLALHLGLMGWIVGSILGCVLAILAYQVFRFLLKLSDKWLPPRPPCNNGKCFYDDYEFVEAKQDGDAVFRCKCGTKYIQSLAYFKEILSEGSLKPYMKKNKIGQWIPDNVEE